MKKTLQQVYNTLGPILLSALSIFITFIILQPIALWIDPTFNFCASRGIGKVAFVTIVIFQLLLFMLTQPLSFLNKCMQSSLLFFKKLEWIKTFFIYFLTFFSFHTLLLASFLVFGFAQYNPNWGIFNLSLILKLFWGFFVVFMLAWSEEVIFRSVVYQYLAQQRNKLLCVFAASLIFMFAHDLGNPLNLVTTNWKLGLGLFLLGMLLNTIFVITGKLYAGMGIHAGLVFVKVVLRKARFIIIPATGLPFWVNSDLRQSLLVHLLFAVLIVALIIKNKKVFYKYL